MTFSSTTCFVHSFCFLCIACLHVRLACGAGDASHACMHIQNTSWWNEQTTSQICFGKLFCWESNFLATFLLYFACVSDFTSEWPISPKTTLFTDMNPLCSISGALNAVFVKSYKMTGRNLHFIGCHYCMHTCCRFQLSGHLQYNLYTNLRVVVKAI